jgi:hypothetical protein
MKRNLLTILLCLSAMFAFNTNGNAQGTLIHYWNFNTYTAAAMYTPTITPVTADMSLTTPKAAVLYTALAGDGTYGNWNSYFDTKAAISTDYDTVNARMGAIDGTWARCRNPCDSMQFLFYMPTTGYQNLLIKYGTQLSSLSGADVQNYSYSIDSGATWKTSGLSTQFFVADTAATAFTFKLASVNVTDPAANNNPKFVFRITFQYHNTGYSGNDRFDNISLDGDATAVIPGLGVNTIVPQQPYTITPNPVTNSLIVNNAIDGSKSVIIYNALVQRIYTSEENSKHFTINTTDFAAGTYFISIREKATGNVSNMKFTKQ